MRDFYRRHMCDIPRIKIVYATMRLGKMIVFGSKLNSVPLEPAEHIPDIPRIIICYATTRLGKMIVFGSKLV